jgi:hypothetical protein
MVPSTLRVYLAKTTSPMVRNTILRRLESGGRISRNELYSEVLHERSKAKAMPRHERGGADSSCFPFSEPDLVRTGERRGGQESDRSRLVAELILRRLSRKDYDAIMTEMSWEIWNRVLVWLRAARTLNADHAELVRPGAFPIAVQAKAVARRPRQAPVASSVASGCAE